MIRTDAAGNQPGICEISINLRFKLRLDKGSEKGYYNQTA